MSEKFAVELIPGDTISLYGGMLKVKIDTLWPRVLAGMVAAIMVDMPEGSKPLQFHPLERVEVDNAR